MSWSERNSRIKQPGVKEKEEKTSRHLNAVATSTLHKKQAQHQLARRKLSRQDHVVATTFVLGRRRDNIKLLRQPLCREDVATRSSYRDNNYTERTSRQDQVVVTTTALQICRSHTETCDKPATRPTTRPATSCDKNCDKDCDNICILGQFAKVQQEMPQN